MTTTKIKTAYNERFGASGAVTRPKVCANLQVLRPSERQWKPRLRQAAGALHASGRQHTVDKSLKTGHLRQRGKTCEAARAGRKIDFKMKKILLLGVLLLGILYAHAQTQGYILKIENGKVYMDLHAPDVKIGDIVGVYVEDGYLVHPVTKQKIKKEPELAGHIIVENVYASYSVGKGQSDMKSTLMVGQIVRKETEMREQSSVTNTVSTVQSVIQSVNPSVNGKIAVVVTPAEVNDVVGVGHFGGYVADMLMEHLLLCDRITLVDRSVLNAQIDEANLTGQYIDPKTAVKKGKIIGAKYIVQVTMQKPDVVNTKTGIPLASVMGATQSISGVNIGAQYASNMGTATLRAAVSISTRVIDMETGEVVFMCNGNGAAKGKSQIGMEYGALGGTLINGGVGGFKQTITGQAIGKAFVTIGNTLNDFFNGKTDKKVVGFNYSPKQTEAQMYSKGSSLYLGSKKLDKDEISDVFAENPQLYFDYKSGKSMRNWSWVPIIVGGMTTLMTIGMYADEGVTHYWDAATQTSIPDRGVQTRIIGFGLLGTSICVGGIYLYNSGAKKIQNVATQYNRHQSNQTNLGLVVTDNGLGLRLTF